MTLEALRAGYLVVEEPVVMRPRQGGRSAVTWRTAVRTCVALSGARALRLAPHVARPAATEGRPAQTASRLSADSPTRATT